ncbi:MAG TPA: TIGR04283 family arsenosugar biosynthesis glycosyltransferase [Tepidisphaeraceae bacterium]|jgi:rSAM/selenodomain-associated transferase 2
MISIIIPCWNDAAALEECLGRIVPISGGHEIIVADASSTPACAAIARSFAGVRLVARDQPNRGRQMNAGAAIARGDALLFQHADTELSADHLAAIETAMRDPQVIGGAFHRKFHPSHTRRQWLVPLVRRWQARRKIFYGDQSLFARREHFQRMGGYAPIALLEDVEFSRRLKRCGGRVVVLDPPVLSSARRHTRHGRLRVTLENLAMVWLFNLGVSPDRLHRWYYRKARRLSREGNPSALGTAQITSG